jgi:type IV secretion system protein VirB8
MTEPSPDSRDSYYARAASWAADRQDALRLSRTIAWIVAGVAAAVAIFEAMALMALAPLKTVVPYTVLVDRNTGFVQVLKGTEPDAIARDTALTQSQLAQYVIAREAFDIGGITGQYRKVALWSADAARRDYLATVPASSPESPLRRYPRSTVVTARVKSVSLIDNNGALVRFETERLDEGQATGQRNGWIALVRYRYSGAPMSIEDRLVNPLGFQVIRYQRDAEILPEPVPATAPAPGLAPAPALAPLPAAPVIRPQLRP